MGNFFHKQDKQITITETEKKTVKQSILFPKQDKQLKKAHENSKEQVKSLSIKYNEGIFRNRVYEFCHDDAKKMSKKGFEIGEALYSVQECRIQMKNQLRSLNTDYKYNFHFKESPQLIKDAKKMTRTIYLKFICNNCSQNQWTSIAGTFQISFRYTKQQNQFSFLYYIRIYGEQCRICKQLISPLVYQIQMRAMEIFFSVIVTNIIEENPPPKKPQKYYIRKNHWHKKNNCVKPVNKENVQHK